MIGIRATSGSVAIRLRNVVIACSLSSRSASMLTSSRLAPPRTCSSATSTAAWWSSASISRRNRAEPVTLVRSPIITKPVSGPIANGSRPLNRVRRRRSRHRARRAAPRPPRRSARCASGVVPQQPPTMLTRPAPANSPSSPAVSLGRLVVAAERVGQAGVGVAGDVGVGEAGQLGDVRAHLGRRRASSSRRRRAARRARSSARTPRRSGRTACGRTGRRSSPRSTAAGAGATSRAAAIGGLRVERVEDRLDQQQVDAALGERRDLLGVGRVDLVEASPRGRPGRRPPGDSDSVTLSGPIEPATNRPPASSAACRASCAPRTFISRTQRLQAVVGLADAASR